jgi:hypothetical protein
MQAGPKLLRYSDALRQLFDPSADPSLRPGYVNEHYRATSAQLDAARHRLVDRRREFAWRTLGNGERVAARLAASGSSEALPASVLAALSEGRALAKPLPFYPGGLLVHVPGDAPELAHRFALAGGDLVQKLDGTNRPIHELNRHAPIELRPGTVEEYVGFFCEHVHGDGGGFYVIEEESVEGGDRRASDEGSSLVLRASDVREGPLLADHRRDEVFVQAELAWPITVIEAREEGTTALTTCIYANEAFRAAFWVQADGGIQMVEDLHVPGVSLDGPELQWLPTAADARR